MTCPRAILFDWDNTLVDNWTAIQAAFNATLSAFGRRTWTLDETKARVRGSLRDTFPSMFGERWEEARAIYYQAFSERHLDALSALPEAAMTLEGLAASGVYLAVVSNKQGTLLRKEAAHLGWDRLFGRVVGATDAVRDKPSPEPVALALAGSGVAPGPEAWFVGDAGIDMACAHASGCVPVLLDHGGVEEKEFQMLPPRLRISHLNELIALAKRGL